jgi:protein-S-isoprenylcysteine O-methyltransferase Ste14
MSDQQNAPAAKPFWRRGLAGFLDFLTVFFVAGYIIGSLTGNTTSEGFKLEGWPALVLFAVIVLYFYLGWKKLGGTIWQRILKAR